MTLTRVDRFQQMFQPNYISKTQALKRAQKNWSLERDRFLFFVSAFVIVTGFSTGITDVWAYPLHPPPPLSLSQSLEYTVSYNLMVLYIIML